MIFLASRNFQRADELLKSPPLQIAKIVQTLGPDDARVLLRHLVKAENRLNFNSWEQVQLFLGVLLTGVLFLLARNRLLGSFSAAMLLLVVLGHYKITPELDWLSGNIEFLAAGAESAERAQFWKLHTIYGVLEAAKLLLGISIASVLFTFSHRRPRSQVELDVSQAAAARRV